MKLIELSDKQLIELAGGDGWQIGISCGFNIPGGWGCQIGIGYSKEISGASRDEQIRAHNEAQWYYGEVIRAHGNDGSGVFSTNTAPSGAVEGYR